MPRVKKEELQKVTLNLSMGDKDTLSQFFPAVGWSVAARRIINRACRRLQESDSQSEPTGGKIDINIGDIGEEPVE